MAINIKGITVKIGADTSDLTKKLNQIKSQTSGLDSTMYKLRNSMKKVDGGNFKSFASYQDLVAQKMQSLNKQINVQKTALSQLDKSSSDYTQKASALNASIATMENQLKALSNEFISTNTNVLKTVYGLEKASATFDKVSESTRVLSMLSGGTLAGAAAAAISFEDAWTGVLKTVEGTPEQLEAVNEGLKKLATSTSSSYEDIAHFAELAGQMGVATDSVLGFTDTVVKLNDTTNLLGDEAAQSIAKYANIMVSSAQQSNDYFSRLGSTIVDLGNNFATTENDIMQMAMRLATAGRQVGLSSQEILGLSTALSSMGIEAAAGGGSVSKMLKTVELAVATGNKSLAKFAEVSGMTSKQFQKAWEEDASNAFLRFVEGIGKTENVTKTLDELGIKEIRQAQAMGVLAQNSELLASALSTANSAWENNSAMTAEAEKRYSTLKSTLIQTWEAIKQAGNELGQAVTPTIKEIAEFVKNLALSFADLDEGTQQTIANFLLFGAAISPVAKGASKLTKGMSSLIKAASKGHSTFTLVASALNLTSASAADGEVSFLSLAKSMAMAHPIAIGFAAGIGIAATAAAVAAAAQKEFTENVKETMEAQNAAYVVANQVIEGYEDYTESVESLRKANSTLKTTLKTNAIESENLLKIISQLNEKEELNSAQKALMKQSIEELNSIYPELGLKMDENTGRLMDDTGATLENVDAIRERISALQEQAREEANAEMIKNTAKALAETTAQYELQKQSIQDIASQRKVLLDKAKEQQNITMEEAEQLKILNGQLIELQTQYGETTSKMTELMSQQYYYENYMETKDYSVMGQGLITQLQSMMQSASDAGWQIPARLAFAISNPESIESVNTACNLLATMTSFQGLVDKSGMFGGIITSTLANSLINNAGSLQGGIDAMNNMMNFIQMVNTARAEGKNVTAQTAQGMAEDAGFVGDSAKQLGKAAADAFKDSDVKNMPKDAEEADKKIASTFKNSSVPGAVDTMGSSMASTFATYLGQMESSAATTYSNIKSGYDSAKRYVSTPIEITKKETVEKQEKGMPVMMRASRNELTNSIMETAGKYVEPYASVPMDVRQTVMAERTIHRNSSQISSSALSKLSVKIDKLITSFENMDIVLKMQPMELNGEVVTDAVDEIHTIRDLLSSAGKGGV